MSESSGPYEVIPGALDIPGVHTGWVTDAFKQTGVTALVFAEGAWGSVDVAGGGPATRETPALHPANTIQGPDAIILTGGSALGLGSADGAAQELRRQGRGVVVGRARIPIVAAAAIFDMDVGLAEPPTAEDGAAAVRIALCREDPTIEEGPCGAGTGASVGKSLGPDWTMRGGQGAVTIVTPDGLRVGAVVVVNAVGSILNEDGGILAGPRMGDEPKSTVAIWSMAGLSPRQGEATTIGVVCTNAALHKGELSRVARMGQDGLARAIDPVHSPWDGDTLFAVSLGDRKEDVGRVGALAGHAVALAVRRAVRAAQRRGGFS